MGRLLALVLGAGALLCLDVGLAQQAPPRTIHDITALLDQYQPEPEKIEALKAQLNAEPPRIDNRIELAQFFAQRAAAAEALGMSDRQIADLRRAAEFAKGWQDGEWQIAMKLAVAELFVGNSLNGLRLVERTLPLVRGARGREIVSYAIIATIRSYRGDLPEARSALRNAQAVAMQIGNSPAWATWGYSWTNLLERARASLLRAEGKYGEAEEAYRKALEAGERFLEIAPRLIETDPSGVATLEMAYRGRDITERQLAELLLAQGRLREAEVTMRNVLQNSLKRLGRYSNATAWVTTRLGDIYLEQARYRDAAALAHAALDSFEKSGTAPDAVTYNSARRVLGAALVAQGRWQEALQAYDKLRAAVGGDLPTLQRLGLTDLNWAQAQIKTGRAAEALPMLETMVKTTRGRLGEGHYQVAEQRGFLALALAEAGQRSRALVEFQETVRVLLARGRADADEESESPARARRLALILEGYIKLLFDIRDELRRPGFEPAAEAFRLADAVRGGDTQRALAASAARAAAGTPALADLVRKEQDARQQIAALYGLLTRLLSAPPDQQLPQVVTQMRARIEELEKERRALLADLERRFPAYVDLIHPRPATVEQARAALREGEALMSVLVADDRTHVWVVPKSGAVAFYTAKLGGREVGRIVAHLRRALDLGEVTLERFPEFDTVAAHRLYADLLKPVESAWQGAHTLMVVANGALAQVPFSVLVTEAVAPAAQPGVRFERYRAVPWLVKQAAVVQLPAVNTLVTLRALPQASAARSPFIGFGDPQFGGGAPAAAAQPVALRMRDAALARPEEGKPAEWTPYSRLAPLPDTREEILAIAAALKADPLRDVFLGAQASKRNVKGADLASRRIVAFATHGLIPGDLPNLEQPALALAAPSGSQEEGLLTLEDILGLKLDADWVVLSACNTAAGEGAGAEAISGLGRGFFYAGSRALLVTHWPVETRSARLLVSGLFERYGTQGISRAEALRQASLAVMDDSAKDAGGAALFSYAHPVFWAPYALVGDGGR